MCDVRIVCFQTGKSNKQQKEIQVHTIIAKLKTRYSKILEMKDFYYKQQLEIKKY